MRILPGSAKQYANQTTTTQHLANFLVSNPEWLPNVFTMFDSQFTAFSSLLTRRNMYEGKLALKPNSKGYTVVGNRKVMWNVKGMPERKITFVKDAEYVGSNPGQYQTIIKIFCDSNWLSPKEVIGLADDHRSQLYNATDALPEEDLGLNCFTYKMKVNTNNPADYVDATLLKAGMEANVLFTQYEEMSKTAQEKYTFDESASTYMTIQRLKWSMSGSAEATKTGVVWMEHNGVYTWATKAQLEAMQRAAMYRENQLMFGKSTVDPNGKIIMKTLEGYEVCAGDGITNQGDGAWKLPYNDLTMKVMEDLMSNVKIYNGDDGPEVALICGNWFRGKFNELMLNKAGVESKVVEMNGTGKGINMDYDYYKWNGVKIIPTAVPFFDSPFRASLVDENGIKLSSKRAIIVSMGNVGINEPAVELLALGNRDWLEGEINGINKGGDMANSVDGMSHHILWETGVALRDIDGVAELYSPVIRH